MDYKDIAFQKDKEMQESNKELNEEIDSLYFQQGILIVIIIALVGALTYTLTGSIL